MIPVPPRTAARKTTSRNPTRIGALPPESSLFSAYQSALDLEFQKLAAVVASARTLVREVRDLAFAAPVRRGKLNVPGRTCPGPRSRTGIDAQLDRPTEYRSSLAI